MSTTTTVRVSVATKESLKELAAEDGVSMESLLRLILRRERQRRMGEQDAARGLDAADRSWLAGTAHQVGTLASARR